MAATPVRHGIQSGLLSLSVLLVLVIMALPRLDAPERRINIATTLKTQPPAPARVAPAVATALVLPDPPPASAPKPPPEATVEPVIPAPPRVSLGPVTRVTPVLKTTLKPTKDGVVPKPVTKALRPVPELPKPERAPADKHEQLKHVVPAPTPPRVVLLAPVVSRPAVREVQLAAKIAPGPPKVITSPQAKRTGRVLLRQLEHGKGPGIEIAWPANPRQRQRLHTLLTKCHGMRAARMSRDGRLFVADGAQGKPWSIDMDRMSGFVRQVVGTMTPAERQAVERIAAHHGGPVPGAVVRLFPRAVDAGLLGGLQTLGGLNYETGRSVTAVYFVDGARVLIGDIRVDGLRIAGGFELPRGGGGCP